MEHEDRVGKVLEKLAAEASVHTASEVVFDAAAAIPFAGGTISAFFSGVATRKVAARAVDVFRAVKERLESVEENQVDKAYFESDEFQTVLALSIEQLQTTHDAEKLKMLANALANSGLVEFSKDDRKEHFLRIFRDLPLKHIVTLKSLMPPAHLRNVGPSFWPTQRDPKGEELAIFNKLESHGLVAESLTSNRKISGPSYGNDWSINEATRAINEALKATPSRDFRMTKFGLDFLTFLGQTPAE